MNLEKAFNEIEVLARELRKDLASQPLQIRRKISSIANLAAVGRAGIPENEQPAEPDLEKLGFCLKCGTRPCTCEEKYGEKKAG